jgi:predicted MPP superfamily phosphohydrolase
MDKKATVLLLVIAFFVVIDLYVYQIFRYLFQDFSGGLKKTVQVVYWSVTGLTIAAFLLYHLTDADYLSKNVRNLLMVGIFINYLSKTFALVFLVIDDLIRLGQWAYQSLAGKNSNPVSDVQGKVISRSDFLMKTAVIAGGLPAIGMTFGIISGAHDYRIRKKTIYLPNLPKEWDGITIGQLSDIHSGSFFNKKGVIYGVEKFMAQKPDLVFFTGDLVNTFADEVEDYIPIFSRIKAPLGVFSTLGNHDYGDYADWKSAAAKNANLEKLKSAHRQMNWDLLCNENRMLEDGGNKLAIIGVENWGAGRFAKYGDLDKAYQGTNEAEVKLLLSHDPSHWDAQIKPKYSDIDVTFSGHTHGFQFGVELGDFKWSPSQYIYKQWAGLYQDSNQYLYVNRGFGFIGYPGRIGILPELTIIELKQAV